MQTVHDRFVVDIQLDGCMDCIFAVVITNDKRWDKVMHKSMGGAPPTMDSVLPLHVEKLSGYEHDNNLDREPSCVLSSYLVLIVLEMNGRC